jgi:WD40 repeat protein
MFSPDGKTLASGSWDGRVKLWSLEGVLLKELKWSDGGILDIDFSFDGKLLAAATAEGKVILWSLDLDNLVGRACEWLGDYLQTNPNVSPWDRLLCSG